MILSTNRELGEFEIIVEPNHIKQVWKEIEGTLPRVLEDVLGNWIG